MVHRLHDGMIARVTDDGAVSEAFAVTNRAKQSCVLKPTLFSFMFSVMLMDAYRNECHGLHITYRMCDRLLNQWRMHFHSRAANYEANQIATTKVKRVARKLQVPRINTVNAQSLQHARAVKAPAAQESACLETFGRDAATIRQLQPLRQLLPTLLRTPFHDHPWHQFHQSHYYSDHIPIFITCYLHHHNQHCSSTILIATAPFSHVSAWSITCKSIVQRLVNQCLEH
ncbi:unnamed protein product [Schistocephalus solidus]|uniref:Uncharacterized protein n=1 Tax=Schistocephalus solidus TaxID=70667 RepID=A0A183TIM7_SCHSO|nr:unnamed protein product [Schistocephalus solidus]